MKIGLITDMHLGYSRANRENEHGVNQREQDIIDSAQKGVNNLVNAGVDAIVDLGDMAHTPAPKKRAVMALVNMIRNSDVPWYSANGNHTLQRTKSDIHLYDVLESLCQNFKGFVQPGFVRELGFWMIPYGAEQEIFNPINGYEEFMPEGTQYVAGHFACDDVPFPGEHVSALDLPSSPIVTFLGHYHTRSYEYDGPKYIGATDRLAWGEANNPTGVCVLDTAYPRIDFIDHEAREWVDLQTTAEGVMDVLTMGNFTEKIVRLTVEATGPEYHNLDIKTIREVGRTALEFSIRREGTAEAFAVADHTDTQTYSLMEAWENHIENAKKQIKFHKREIGRYQRMLDIGNEALSKAGVIDA